MAQYVHESEVMAAEKKAIEVSGVVDEDGWLTVDKPLRSIAPGRVRLIVLAPQRPRESAEQLDEEEREWLAAAAANPAFAFLHDPAEEVYGPEDGQPFRDEG